MSAPTVNLSRGDVLDLWRSGDLSNSSAMHYLSQLDQQADDETRVKVDTVATVLGVASLVALVVLLAVIVGVWWS